jgi:cell wall-associated NlpC family hydrolase
MRARLQLLIVVISILQVGCASGPAERPEPLQKERAVAANQKGAEVVLFALSLVDTGYRFGGKNPEAGLDCSGMVSYVYEQAVGMRLVGNAAQLAKLGREVGNELMQPGDLVFFNTRNFPHSHVGIYVGEGKFVHAPKASGRVMVSSLRSGYFADRFEEARRFLD